LLALQNSNFSQTLYNWKRSNVHKVIAEFEAEAIRKSLREIAGLKSNPNDPENDSITRLLVTGLGSILENFIQKTKTTAHHEDR